MPGEGEEAAVGIESDELCARQVHGHGRGARESGAAGVAERTLGKSLETSGGDGEWGRELLELVLLGRAAATEAAPPPPVEEVVAGAEDGDADDDQEDVADQLCKHQTVHDVAENRVASVSAGQGEEGGGGNRVCEGGEGGRAGRGLLLALVQQLGRGKLLLRLEEGEVLEALLLGELGLGGELGDGE